jgi:hypothetical protein
MSRAIASARQRRAGIEPATTSSPKPVQQTPAANGLTLPQVISLVDTRLIKLEQFMKDSLENGRFVKSVNEIEVKDMDGNTVALESDPAQLTDLNQILDEFNNRFVMLAEEIGQLKDTLMKLQTYTMDVNKMLLEERVNVLSDLGNDNSMFVMNSTVLPTDELETIPEETA